MKKARLNSDYEKVINAWKQAANELNLRIESPVTINSGNREIIYPLLIKDFGGKQGTIAILIDDDLNLSIAKYYGYYCSKLNSRSYTKYSRNLFINTLNDWGFFGDDSNKPDWYTGHRWS
jgi:hypothetical protein